MVAVTAGELSPIVAGIVYCNTIAFCQGVYELRRAREWTSALTRWCEQQPDMVAHNGLCLVHRAQLMTLGGSWPQALEELQRLGERFTDGVLNQRALGHAAYQRGEVLRLRGDFAAAESAFGEAPRFGREPQPGLALMRLAQGNVQAAAAGIRRAVMETTRPAARAALLPAYVEIMLAAGDLEAASSACRELERIAAEQRMEMLLVIAAAARGAVALAEGDTDAALSQLRQACRGWQELGAPHEAARVRVLLALTCRRLGDEDSAALELAAAREVFAQLGAAPSLAWADAQTGEDPPAAHSLSGRELEVLRLVAAGNSNRQIAAALVISERTVARHLQNIFAKLRVSSRTAASAFAFEHHLV
jgi:DNA-binding CsgD family transcriptional regulator